MPAIHRSVGRHGVNDPADVRVVQHLLNGAGLPSQELLRVDGLCGPKTQGAIDAFQSRAATASDGRIDPHGATLRKLVELQLTTLLRGIDPAVAAMLKRTPDAAASAQLAPVLEQVWQALRRAG